MSLTSGTRLGPYEILAPLGAGGMGEVYRARDARLNREVALKVLPEAFARDAERMARFEREAQVLASLNHPNIAALYGLEESGGVRALVMELVEGPTLAERIEDGPIAIDEALPIARQIAEALEAAHEKGIMHRDLKPANVKVTPAGAAKVLDFGLAKALDDDPGVPNASNSPTISLAATRAGVILGTAAYMSPEQARGNRLDKRADIWSFGCLLYEMLTGRQSFRGESISDTLASVLKTDPDWSALPAATPANIQTLLRRCLQRDSPRRLHDIADARLEIEEALAHPASAVSPSPRPRVSASPRLAWALAALLAVVAAVTLWRALSPAPRPVTRTVVALPAGDRLAIEGQPALALSPDGARLVYAATRAGRTQLYLRRMDQFDATAIPGTEDGGGPFFSPDGEWVGFFASGKLKKVSLGGGVPVVLCEAPSGRGGSWGSDGAIIFTPMSTAGIGLSRVSASGGAPQVLTAAETKKGEFGHRWPEILPGGKAVLSTLWRGGGFDDARIAALIPETGEQRILVEGGSDAHYAATGHLVFTRTANLMAVPFDAVRLRVTGAAFLLVHGVAIEPNTGAAHYSVSASGSLVYLRGGAGNFERLLVWVDRKGVSRPLTDSRRFYMYPRISPDGRRLAVTVPQGSNRDIWVYEFARDTLTRLTFQGIANNNPVWAPDGKRIAFRSSISGPQNLFWKQADFSGAEEQLYTSPNSQVATSFSPDGNWLAFDEPRPSTGTDIWILPMQGEHKPRPFVQTQLGEWGAVFSPDGRRLAYVSNESGRNEVCVQPFPGPGEKLQISTDGGAEPVWARNGRELFYRNGDKMMAVDITTQPSFAAGKPRLLFEGHYDAYAGFTSYDVSPDGRFVMVKAGDLESAPTQVNVTLNWFADLERRAGMEKK